MGSFSKALPILEQAPAAPKPVAKGPYIAGATYDWCFFILSPLLALLVGWLVGALGLDQYKYLTTDDAGRVHRIALVALASAVLTHAHLVIVFFRSHLNRAIFRLHPHRFVTVPLVLFVAAVSSQWVFVAVSVLTVWWDVYHSSLQTFGLGRIYDQRAGNDVNVARRADYLFNLVVYTGPVLAGVNLWAHLKSLKKFDQVDGAFLSNFANLVFAHDAALRWVIVAVGAVFTAGYLLHYARLARQGYVWPRPKLVLYLVTAFVSVACWGFGSFGEAFLIMNLFHAVQYFAIVWWSEKKTIMKIFHCAPEVALSILLVGGIGYGLWRTRPSDFVPFVALGNVISLMHFWYDGFVWSVRKGQV